MSYRSDPIDAGDIDYVALGVYEMWNCEHGQVKHRPREKRLDTKLATLTDIIFLPNVGVDHPIKLL